MRLAALALALSAVLASATHAQDAALIRIDPVQRFQTITGWEATADIPDTPAAPAWAPWHEAALDRVVNDGGINRVRLEIRSGAESNTGIITQFVTGQLAYDDWKDRRYQVQNDNDDPFTINWQGFDFGELDWYVDNTILGLKRRVEARGEKLYINLCYVSFRDGRYFQMEPEEYAEFVLATYLHLKEKYGLTPDSWEVVLEPDLPKDGWTGTDMGRAILAAGNRLKANGFTPAFVAPSVTNMKNAVPYMDAIAAVPGALAYVHEFSYHRYKGTGAETLQAIEARARALNLPTAMLELWFGKATYDVLFNDLKIGNVTAWQGRMVEGMFRPDDTGALQPRQEVATNRLLFRAVRAGAVRISAESDHPKQADALAFLNPDGRMAIAVRNRSEGEAITTTLTGLAPARYHADYAGEGAEGFTPGDLSPDASGTLTLTLPGKGLLVLSSTGGA